MNKLLIIFLAVCLINVHAFVKRGAEPTEMEKILQGLTKEFDEFKTKMAADFEPEQMKKKFSEFVDKANTFVNNMKPNEAAPK